MSKILQYFEQSGTTQSILADRIGVTRGYMSLLVSGNRSPSGKVAALIEKETEGAVPASSWFDLEGFSPKSAHPDSVESPTSPKQEHRHGVLPAAR